MIKFSPFWLVMLMIWGHVILRDCGFWMCDKTSLGTLGSLRASSWDLGLKVSSSRATHRWF